MTAHGMGDSCFNPGMKQITQLIASTLGTYGVCVPTGDNLGTDTTMVFPAMDKNVDAFAARIRNDAQLAVASIVVASRGQLSAWLHPEVQRPAGEQFPLSSRDISGVAGFPNYARPDCSGCMP